MPQPAERQARRQERGQVMVLCILGLTALIGMAGLVLDGGDTFSQRRAQQNAADLAAVAGANAFLNTSGPVDAKKSAAITAATSVATQNGYTNGSGGATVSITNTLLSAGLQVNVKVTKPHQNNFARVFGMNTWDVSVSAEAISGVTDTATTAAPWLMSILAFNAAGSPIYTANNPAWFGQGNGDYPTNALDIAWTDFQAGTNVNTSVVSSIIQGTHVVTATIFFEQYIGQHNNGYHAALFSDVDTYLSGHDVPIAIVGPGSPNCSAPTQQYSHGCFKGWAMFHVLGASGGSQKQIHGYFTGTFIGSPMSIGDCTPQLLAAGTCGVVTAHSPFLNYIVKLSN